MTPSRLRSSCCMVQKQPPARTARSVFLLIARSLPGVPLTLALGGLADQPEAISILGPYRLDVLVQAEEVCRIILPLQMREAAILGFAVGAARNAGIRLLVDIVGLQGV